jgi:ketosteroid isomerase-like protein
VKVNIESLSKSYVDSFNSRDIEAVSELLDENIVLTDPTVNALTPKRAVLDMISNLFLSCDIAFSFVAQNILVDLSKNTSIVEFELELNDKTLKGVDIMCWRNGKIVKLSAYLY